MGERKSAASKALLAAHPHRPPPVSQGLGSAPRRSGLRLGQVCHQVCFSLQLDTGVRNRELGLGGYVPGIVKIGRVNLELARPNNGKTKVFCWLAFAFYFCY